MKQDSLLTILGRNSKNHAGSVNPPVYKTSTVLFPKYKDYYEAATGTPYYEETNEISGGDYSYGIAGTPITQLLQKSICELEGGVKTFTTPSGLSAITLTLLSLLKPGDHILVVDSIYGPTRRFCNNELKKLGIETSYYSPHIKADIKNLVQKNTRLIFLESPGSLTFELQDIKTICRSIKSTSENIVTVLDNSWATPLYFKPFENGIDVSIQAITKYIAGHSDVIMGAVTVGNKKIDRQITSAFRNYGLHVSPDDCYQALKGLRTLSVRLKHQAKSALQVATWLEKQGNKVEAVLYPSLKSHPDHKIWKRDFTGAASLFSFVLKKNYPDKIVHGFVDSLQYFSIGCSWGGYESLVLPFNNSTGITRTAKNTDGAKGSGAALKYTGKHIIRLYIGLEDVSDLIGDLETGLKRLK